MIFKNLKMITIINTISAVRSYTTSSSFGRQLGWFVRSLREFEVVLNIKSMHRPTWYNNSQNKMARYDGDTPQLMLQCCKLQVAILVTIIDGGKVLAHCISRISIFKMAPLINEISEVFS